MYVEGHKLPVTGTRALSPNVQLGDYSPSTALGAHTPLTSHACALRS